MGACRKAALAWCRIQVDDYLGRRSLCSRCWPPLTAEAERHGTVENRALAASASSPRSLAALGGLVLGHRLGGGIPAGWPELVAPLESG